MMMGRMTCFRKTEFLITNPSTLLRTGFKFLINFQYPNVKVEEDFFLGLSLFIAIEGFGVGRSGGFLFRVNRASMFLKRRVIRVIEVVIFDKFSNRLGNFVFLLICSRVL